MKISYETAMFCIMLLAVASGCSSHERHASDLATIFIKSEGLLSNYGMLSMTISDADQDPKSEDNFFHGPLQLSSSRITTLTVPRHCNILFEIRNGPIFSKVLPLHEMLGEDKHLLINVKGAQVSEPVEKNSDRWLELMSFQGVDFEVVAGNRE